MMASSTMKNSAHVNVGKKIFQPSTVPQSFIPSATAYTWQLGRRTRDTNHPHTLLSQPYA